MIIRARKYLTEPVGTALLESVLSEFQCGAERRAKLRAAYENDREIMHRKRLDGLPNNRLAHSYPRYIATMASGYLIGKPITYSAEKGDEKALEALLEAYKKSDVQSVDAELAKKAAIYGVGIELLYADENARPKTAAINPETAFVVYDDSVENKPMLGVRYSVEKALDGSEIGYRIWAYTENTETQYTAENITGPYIEAEAPKMHYFGGVPMIEYWNSEDEKGDFESVMTLIDAYDTLQSDRINDKEQFVDALLVLTGCRLETNENGETPGQQLRKEKLLFLPDSDAKAEYLARNLPETEVEVLREAIKKDIHKFSMVPEMTDQEFAGNASGVAMRYKLLGLEQLVRIKERWFREALRERIRRFSAFLAVRGEPTLDAENVEMTFTRSLPVNDLEIAQTVATYNGIIPTETLYRLVPFIENAQEEAEKALAERREQARMQAAAFSVPMEQESAEE